jgi:hypothetical protein
MASPMETGFVMFRKYLANGEKCDPVHVASLADTRDESRFPMGRQTDSRGAFIWTYCAAPYWGRQPTAAQERRDALAFARDMGAPSVPLPSAAGAILAKLASRGAD